MSVPEFLSGKSTSLSKNVGQRDPSHVKLTARSAIDIFVLY